MYASSNAFSLKKCLLWFIMFGMMNIQEKYIKKIDVGLYFRL